jgi:hypothetical protein
LQGLLCDEESGECVPCTEHGQCEAGACAKAEGTCFAAGALVLHVDEDMSAPEEYYASVGTAVGAVEDGGVAVIVVHAIDDGSPYTGAPRIAGGKTIALLAAPGEQPTLLGVSNPGLRVEGVGTVVYMEGLALAGSTTSLGLQVTAATAWVDRSRIVDNNGGGILAESGATLTVRNSFVGQDASSRVSIAVSESNAQLLNNTVIGGFGMNTEALECTGVYDVDVRNSIFATLSSTAEMNCLGAAVSFSAAETNPGGEGSIAIGPVDETVMADFFAEYATGNYHLGAEGLTVFDGIAQWQLGDPATDIDGDARPTTNGAADYAGADVP